MSHAPAGLALVEITDLTVRRQRDVLLSNVSMAVARGSVHAVVGPNGAGKSTLLTAILGLTSFGGRIVVHWQRDGRIGYVPQALTIDRTLPVTVEDFLALTRQRRPVCLGVGRETRARISMLLARVGLAGLERRPLAVLSGGELRRVLLAHALDPAPELLILDEPSTGLDEAANRALEELLVALRAGGSTTVLLVSHDASQVRRVADRVTVLDRRVLEEGAPADVLRDASTRDRQWTLQREPALP